jgi:class 3 adenylate cyclase
MTDLPLNLPIDEKEFNLVDGFRQSRNTSVLTIMFTDIQGFTRLTEERGDAFSNEVRRSHDGILVPLIEKDGSGRVIKHIGDAVMAVFSEPSTAVARALEIQEALRKHNSAHPDQPPLLVRIGLHMGQVTVEDKMNMDVFGRHVNRASRVEGLAGGGHVYLTYSVFDSAKGWMAGRSGEAAWVSHGRYRVKGIDEALEIFEAYRPGGVKPQAPQGANKQSSWPRFLPAAALVLAGALGVLGFLAFKSTSVTFEDLGVRTDTTDVMLDHKTRLQFEGMPDDHLRKCLTPIEPGNHLIYYDVSNVTRYYSPLTVVRGKNILHPKFEYFGMPGLEGNTGFEKHGKNEQTFTNSTDYATYDDTFAKHDHKAALSLTMKSAEGGIAPEANPSSASGRAGAKKHHTLFWTLEWTMVLDGKNVSSDKVIVEHDPASPDATEGKKDLWGDSRHRYVLSYRLSDTYAQGEIQAEYAEYK